MKELLLINHRIQMDTVLRTWLNVMEHLYVFAYNFYFKSYNSVENKRTSDIMFFIEKNADWSNICNSLLFLPNNHIEKK